MNPILPAVPSTDITVERVRALARYAALPLSAEREAAVAAILNAWIPDANSLSLKMSAATHQSVLPATVFGHPGTVDTES